MTRIYIEDAGKHVGEEVALWGWLHHKRSSGKIQFLMIRDGSGYIQGVLVKNAVPPEIFAAADAGDAVAAWLQRVTGAPLRLVRLGDAAHARDGNNALHLVFPPSLAAVRAAWTAQAIDVRRFRPNIVLALPADGNEFVEESLEALAWQRDGRDDARLDVTAPCIRCVVPNVDPASARVDGSLLDTLAGLSLQRRPGGTVFGIYARGAAGTRLRVGDVARMVPAF